MQQWCLTTQSLFICCFFFIFFLIWRTVSPHLISYLWEIWSRITGGKIGFHRIIKTNYSKACGNLYLKYPHCWTSIFLVISSFSKGNVFPSAETPICTAISEISFILCKAIMLDIQICIWKITNLSEHQNITPLWWKFSFHSLKIYRNINRYRDIEREKFLQKQKTLLGSGSNKSFLKLT